MQAICERINAFSSSRLVYFQQLLSFGYNFYVWQEGWSSWQPVGNFDLNNLVNNANLHREILPNEWVFDIDGNDWPSVRSLALELESKLNELDIPINRWSSGNFLHYHIFTDDSEITKSDSSWFVKLIANHFKSLKKDRVSIQEVIDLTKLIHRFIPLVLVEKLPKVEGASIDVQKFTSSRCLIRAEGSINEKTYAYKSYLSELSEDQPLVKASWHVKFPEKIAIWKPDVDLYDGLFLLAYKHYIKPEIRHEFRNVKGNEIGWIEKILQSTFTDGRKRLLDLIILPYLITIKGLDSESAFDWAFDWALKCHELVPIQINKRPATVASLRNYIKYRIKRIENIGLKPLSRNNLEKHFSDCLEIMKIWRDKE